MFFFCFCFTYMQSNCVDVPLPPAKAHFELETALEYTFVKDLHNTYSHQLIQPTVPFTLCSNLSSCCFGSVSLLSLCHFYLLSHSVLSLFTLFFIVCLCSLRQRPCYAQQLDLQATQIPTIQHTRSRGSQVTLSESGAPFVCRCNFMYKVVFIEWNNVNSPENWLTRSPWIPPCLFLVATCLFHSPTCTPAVMDMNMNLQC